MKLFQINENFNGTWDEAIHLKKYHEVKELTDEEVEEIMQYGCGELNFIA